MACRSLLLLACIPFFLLHAERPYQSGGTREVLTFGGNVDTACTGAAGESRLFPKQDTAFTLKGHTVEIRFPISEITGAILLLPGWNFLRDDCCRKSAFCTKALAEGYCLVLPEMGRSVYAAGEYAETEKGFRGYPTRTWLIETVIPHLQKKFNLFKPQKRNFVYGISTGGRGAALIALNTKEIFLAGASLSGDFDQTRMTTDRLMRGFYGTSDQFPERWKGNENPVCNAAEFKIPFYIGQGGKDAVNPPEQAGIFFEALKKNNREVFQKSILRIDSAAGHDYKYWDSESENILKYFRSF